MSCEEPSVADRVAIRVRAQGLGICSALAFVAAIAALIGPSLRASAGWIAVPGYVAYAAGLHLLRQLPTEPGQRGEGIWVTSRGRRLGRAAAAAVICGLSRNFWALGLLAVMVVLFEVVQLPRGASRDGHTS